MLEEIRFGFLGSTLDSRHPQLSWEKHFRVRLMELAATEIQEPAGSHQVLFCPGTLSSAARRLCAGLTGWEQPPSQLQTSPSSKQRLLGPLPYSEPLPALQHTLASTLAEHQTSAAAEANSTFLCSTPTQASTADLAKLEEPLPPQTRGTIPSSSLQPFASLRLRAAKPGCACAAH